MAGAPDRSTASTRQKPGMQLQERLDGITARTRQLVQADRLAISERAIADLFSTGIEDRVLTAGTPMPPFALPDARTGKLVRSDDLLALGPLILKFFRGRWCPYCTTELEAWRDHMAEVRRRGALLVAISPQTARQNAFMADQLFRETPPAHRFPILSDTDARAATAFGLAYTISGRDRDYFRSILVNIPHANSGLSYDTAPDSAWRLPISATFVAKQDGVLAFARAHTDFRVRPEPDEVIEQITAPAR